MMRARRIAAAAFLAPLACAAALHAAPPAPAPPAMRMPDISTMATYQVGLISRGPVWSRTRTPHQDSLLAAHAAATRHMRDLGLLLGTGTILGEGKWYGVFLFKDVAQESLGALLRSDPAFKTATLLIEVHRWLAPRGIGDAYAARAKRAPKNPDSLVVLPLELLKKPAFLVPIDPTARVRISADHQAYILDLMLDGRLLAAGPVFDEGELRGVGFFGTDSVTARKLSNDDPAVQSARIDVEMLACRIPWGVLPPRPTVKEAAR